MVSILIAARNEQDHIIACLKAIAQLSYPAQQMEVLIGDDQSEDRTLALIQDFIHDKPHFYLYHISEAIDHQRGKTNVLIQLIRQSKGNYLFFTDADVCVPTHWIQTMLSHLPADTGIVTGVTLIEGPRIFDQLQALDWLYALTAIQTLSDWKIPVTAMGNNMAVSRRAYEATGGYEALPFSLTEDFQLFQAISKQGFGFQNLLMPEVLAVSQPADSLRTLLQQRKRWMRGAMQLPRHMIALLFAQALFTPLVIILAFFFPTLALAIFATKAGLQAVFIHRSLRLLKQQMLYKYLLIYPLYEASVSLLLIAYYFLPIPMEWKGRKYN
ncbi:MAG: glycosyltransferase [Bacteroidota bacterium]